MHALTYWLMRFCACWVVELVVSPLTPTIQSIQDVTSLAALLLHKHDKSWQELTMLSIGAHVAVHAAGICDGLIGDWRLRSSNVNRSSGTATQRDTTEAKTLTANNFDSITIAPNYSNEK